MEKPSKDTSSADKLIDEHFKQILDKDGIRNSELDNPLDVGVIIEKKDENSDDIAKDC